MANVSSNAADVRRGLFALTQSLNPRRRTADGQTFGVRLAKTAAAVVRTRTVDRQEQADGSPLPPLAASTQRKKRRAGLDPRILIATGEMTRIDQIEGDVTITRNEVVMEAGTTEEVKEKVDFAHAGSRHREKRPFYELGADGEAAVDTLVREILDDAARGGGD